MTPCTSSPAHSPCPSMEFPPSETSQPGSGAAQWQPQVTESASATQDTTGSVPCQVPADEKFPVTYQAAAGDAPPANRTTELAEEPLGERLGEPVLYPLTGPVTGIPPRVHPLPQKPPTPERRQLCLRDFRSHNPSLEPDVGGAPQVALQANSEVRHKRKRSPTPDKGFPVLPSKKRKLGSYRYCWELGHEFAGYVFHVNGAVARSIATNIHQLPVPTQVCKRIAYFTDASIRSGCAAAAIVWQENLKLSTWKQRGEYYYHSSPKESATVELFGVACCLEMAIVSINEESATISQNHSVDKEFFQHHLGHTISHLHVMTKEVFVFTDDANALRRIDGTLGYDPNGEMATQMEVIACHSKKLNELGVHLELHLSPGHCGVPGNQLAHLMARETALSAVARKAEHMRTLRQAPRVPVSTTIEQT